MIDPNQYIPDWTEREDPPIPDHNEYSAFDELRDEEERHEQ